MPKVGKRVKVDKQAVHPYVTGFNTAIGGGLNTTQKAALSKLYRYATSLGVWQVSALINTFLNDSELSKYNFRNPAQFKLSYPNGITVGANGLTSDGTSQYYATGVRPSLDLSTSLNDLGIDLFVYNTNATGTTFQFGVNDSANNAIALQQSAPNEGTAATNVFANILGNGTPANWTNMQGYAMITLQVRSGNVQVFMFGQKVIEQAVSVASLPGGVFEMFGFCKNNAGTAFLFTPGTHSHVVVRKSLPDNIVQLWNQALHEYHIDMGRVGKANFHTGDSIGHGLGVTNGAYPELLAAATGMLKQNFCLSGERISLLMDDPKKANWYVPFYNPAVHNAIWQANHTNDIINGLSATDYGTYLTSFINLCKARGWPASKIYVIARYYAKADANGVAKLAYNNAAQSICTATGAKLLDVYTGFKNAANTDSVNFPANDSTHPNNAGQVLLESLAQPQL